MYHFVSDTKKNPRNTVSSRIGARTPVMPTKQAVLLQMLYYKLRYQVLQLIQKLLTYLINLRNTLCLRNQSVEASEQGHQSESECK